MSKRKRGWYAKAKKEFWANEEMDEELGFDRERILERCS